MKLNVGCGKEYLVDYINLDIDKHCNPDIVRDIEKGLPFDNDKFDEIYCCHVLEHLHDLIFVMNEFYRCLKKPKGILHVKVPPFDFEGAFSDPTHVRVFTPHTFKFFTSERFEWIWGFPSNIQCNFHILKFKRQQSEKDFTAWEYDIIMETI